MIRCKSDIDINDIFTENKKLVGLTIDKLYKVIDVNNIGYRIVDDKGRNYWYTKDLFYSIAEERDKKLNSLGI
jgi:hypothetical protein